MTANAGTEGQQEGNLNPTSKSKNVPFISHIRVLAAFFGAVVYLKKAIIHS
jgi:hypothetical protein